ncbi:tetratricopeptide repeat protein [Amycolatopsis thailandensis]|uniref:tetratricopeptide repeat protein n=1 Tax=Amycolatopsis thailandensis TaxID=589330 RepID=UPI00362B9DFC
MSDHDLTRRGVELRYEDRHDEAVRTLREAVVAGEPDAPRELAYALLGADRPREAIKVLNRAIKSGRADLYSLLGSMAAELGDIKCAEKAYRNAIAKGDVEALNDYAVFLQDEERFDEAREVLQRSAELGDALAPGNLVVLYAEDLDDLATATEVGEKYLGPRAPGVYAALAAVYARLGRLEDAESLFRQAIDLDAPRIHQRYARFLWRHRGDLKAAEEEFWEGFNNDEEGWSSALGEFLLDQGRVDEARAVLERGIAWGDLEARHLLDELNSR